MDQEDKFSLLLNILMLFLLISWFTINKILFKFLCKLKVSNTKTNFTFIYLLESKYKVLQTSERSRSETVGIPPGRTSLIGSRANESVSTRWSFIGGTSNILIAGYNRVMTTMTQHTHTGMAIAQYFCGKYVNPTTANQLLGINAHTK